jgi:diaminopimelate epimerase
MRCMGRPFVKMNGLGNDFVVVDARGEPFSPSAEQVRLIADRQRGIGCDQVIAIEASETDDAFMRIWNADGGEVEHCGNAARCVAWLLTEQGFHSKVAIDSKSGVLLAERIGDFTVRIDMGKPRLAWQDIPLSEPLDTKQIELQVGPIDNPILHTPGCVSMGNPHVVYFVPDAEAAPVKQVGPLIEHHHLFPERTNVGFAQILAGDRIRLRVWERGVGETAACGTGACAALVAANRRALCSSKATVVMNGGELEIEWLFGQSVTMTGPAQKDFEGELPAFYQIKATVPQAGVSG